MKTGIIATLPSSASCCYSPAMLKSRMKRQAAATERAMFQLADIHASIVALDDDDLLDLADIFLRTPSTPLKEMASAEMLRRDLKL